MHNLLVIALLSYVTAVAVTDTLTQRIPNALTVPAAAVAVTLSIASHGVTGGLASSAGLLIGLAVFLPFYLLGGFGAGDVKALAAVGAFVGPQGVLLATICTLILGAAGALIVLLVTGGFSALQSMLGRWAMVGYVMSSTGRAAHISAPEGDAARRRFPYGIAIACGTAASLLWG
ncbi:MAG TPA: A24 family peptidase [Steroidobacteraceae bacterium]|jgi:prepilin peptidase CpaA|nr:A24 family peptidase [Steroidobacteraceae bacterium]